MKKISVNARKIILTILANGGAPSGQICPNRTTIFRIRRIIKIPLFING
jgi:hypothetical protein